MRRKKKSDGLVIALGVTTIMIQVMATAVLLNHLGPPQITGAASTEEIGFIGFTLIQAPFCIVPLEQGWSLISLCADPFNGNVTTLLSGVDYRYVMRWNLTAQAWDIYSPRAANNPFDTMEYNTSYFVNLNPASANMNIAGNEAEDLNISMVQGWNGPGYPYVFNTSIIRYFNGTRQRYLMKWDNGFQAFLIYSPRAAVPPFEQINTTEGQMINSYIPDVLVYNKSYIQG